MNKKKVVIRRGIAHLDGRPIPILNLKMLSLIDSGASGAVLEAADTRLNRTVAVKIWWADVQERNIHRALLESRRLAELSHPLLANLYYIGNSNSHFFTVMERVPGRSLRARLKDGTLASAQRFQIGKMIIVAMQYLYEQSLLHGDPHVGNFMVFDDIHDQCAAYRPSAGGKSKEKIGLKVIDLGSSTIKTNRSRLETREVKILMETFERILHDFSVSELVRIRSIRHPGDMLVAISGILELYCIFNWDFKASEPFMIGSGIPDIVIKNPFLCLQHVGQLTLARFGELDCNTLFWEVNLGIGEVILLRERGTMGPPDFEEDEKVQIAAKFEEYQDRLIEGIGSN